MTSYFDILNVPVSANDEEIKIAYRAMAKKLHPDLHPRERRLAELRFKLLNEAYNGLKTTDRREGYIKMLKKKRLPLKTYKNYKTTAKNDNVKSGFFAQISELFKPHDQEHRR